MIGEEYFTLMLDRIKPEEDLNAAAQRYTEKHGQPPRKVLLHPNAAGRNVAAVIQAAETLGLPVERDESPLVWEVWIGG
jgi:hypothetical protein